MIQKTWLPLLFAVVVFACNPKNRERIVTPKDFVWASTTCVDNSNITLLCPYSFLRLFDDGTFTGGALRGFIKGIWKKDSAANQIKLIPLQANTAEEMNMVILQILEKTPLTMEVAIGNDFGKPGKIGKKIMNLQALPLSPDNDPFRTDHQLWREKPNQPESPEQLKNRVLDYLRFVKMFYLFAAENNLENPDTDWFPHPMKMESPGSITMAYANELKDWHTCFYNEDQAVKAYQIISGPFLKVKLKGNPDINERNVDVIDQLLGQLIEKEKK